MVLWVNTTRIILVEIMLQMFHHVISRGPLSLFQLEFVSLSHRCSVLGWMFLCPSLGGDGVRGRDFMVLFLGSGLGVSVEIVGNCPRVLCLGGSSRPSLGRVQTECFR